MVFAKEQTNILKEQNRDLNVTELRKLLPTLCTNIGDKNKFGYGILKAKLLFDDYFETSCIKYLGRIVLCFLVFGLEAAVTYFCCALVPQRNELIMFAVKMIICFIVPNVITVLIFGRTDEFKYFLELVNRTLKRKKG